LDTTVALAHLIFDGVLERFPELKIFAAHGGGYLPASAARMDHAWHAREDCRQKISAPHQLMRGESSECVTVMAWLPLHDRINAGCAGSGVRRPEPNLGVSVVWPRGRRNPPAAMLAAGAFGPSQAAQAQQTSEEEMKVTGMVTAADPESHEIEIDDQKFVMPEE
jgi:hypothetical protein